MSVWGARILSYFFCALAGAAALFITPASLRPEMYIIVGSMLVFGLICMVATILKRYIVEWISMFFLAAGTSTYVTAVWISSISNPKALAGASVFTVLILLMVIRILDLTVYWRRNVRTAKVSVEVLGNDI